MAGEGPPSTPLLHHPPSVIGSSTASRGWRASARHDGGAHPTARLQLVSAPTPRTQPIRLLILGDSLSAGFGLPHADGFESQLQAALKAKGWNVSIIDGAVSGDTSAGGRARLDWVLGDGADAAIVELGANDGLRGVDPKDTEANLAAILDALAARGIPVLLTGMYAPPNLGPDYGQAFRAVYDRLSQRPGVLFDPFFLDGVAANRDLNQPDGMHPNPEGVKRIVARLLPLVEKLLAEAKPA
ncbi:MAG: arylesterase [Proteobacteria bacterium]|nr:arylesterase [Pseudomonadota bacterium]